MRIEPVEIYSDQTNAAVLRHPERQFPGVLLQGDTLHALCWRLDESIRHLNQDSPAYTHLNHVRNALWSLKNEYKSVLVEHDLPMPFSEE